jgi:hypothetical protein
MSSDTFDVSGFAAYDPAVRANCSTNSVTAIRDGYRELPDATPLVLHMASDTGHAYRRYDELWQPSLEAIGIKVDIQVRNFPEEHATLPASGMRSSTRRSPGRYWAEPGLACAFLSRAFANASLQAGDTLASFCFRQAATRPPPG